MMRYRMGFAVSCWLACTCVNAATRQGQAFFQYLLPFVQTANQQIRVQRQVLTRIRKTWQKTRHLSTADSRALFQLATAYGVVKFTPTVSADWTTLATRVDEVPTSMVLAQAANESAWGRSRFARQGHNYFGQWCFRAGCGLTPRRRPPGRHYEVRRFATPLASIKSYLHNLNTNRHYQLFRQLRYQTRQQHLALTGLKLAQGLLAYSTRRDAYVRSIRRLIKQYALSQYDRKIHYN